MNKVTMDQVAQYIMHVATKEKLTVNGPGFDNTLYLVCQSLIKEGRLESKGFHNFYHYYYLFSEYTMGKLYGTFCESKNISELEDKYISILSNLCTDPFVLSKAVRDNSYLMNVVYYGKVITGKRITIGYSELEKENFYYKSSSDCEYKVDLTVSFKAPWYLSKHENFDKLKESIINNIKEENVDMLSLNCKGVNK